MPRTLTQWVLAISLVGGLWANGYTANALPSYVPSPIARTEYNVPAEPSDWLSLINVPPENQIARALVMPRNGEVVYQTPPTLTWPWANHNYSDITYQVELKKPNGVIYELNTAETFVSDWPGFLEYSTSPYMWRVKAIRNNSTLADWSDWRLFYIHNTAQYITPVNVETLYQTAANQFRPRTLPTGEALAQLRAKYIGSNAPYRAEWEYFLTNAGDDQVGGLLGDNPPALGTENNPKDDLNRLAPAAFAAKILGETDAIDRVKERLLNIASWDPNHANIACAVEDTAAQFCERRLVAMALAYDWLYQDLTVAERETVKNAILVALVGDGQANSRHKGVIHLASELYRGPLQSFGATAMLRIVLATTLLAGEHDEFERLFKTYAPMFMAKGSLFGGEDGANGEGTSYGAINIFDTMTTYYAFKKTTGYDLSLKQYFHSMPYYWLYTQPPLDANRIYNGADGTWAYGVFGDGAEEPVMSYYLRKAANFFASHLYPTQDRFAPTIRWYVNQLNSTLSVRPPHWLWMVNPIDRDDNDDVVASSLISSALFASAGQVAMHSSIPDRERVSVFFKSSPYGSWSHSHADQNGFTLSEGGVPLFINSGYYYSQSYGSNHHQNWYVQTRAHNAITFDGGQGQLIGSRGAPGAIMKYKYDTAYGDLTEVIGDATRAYGGTLTEAKRSLMYSKYGIIVIHDKLSSHQSRMWEFNLHALKQMEDLGDNKIRVENRGKTACAKVYSLSPIQFSQTNEFGPDNAYAPPAGENKAQQWHARFSTVGKGKSNEFLTVITPGCSKEATVIPTEEGWRIEFYPRIFEVKNGDLTAGTFVSR